MVDFCGEMIRRFTPTEKKRPLQTFLLFLFRLSDLC